jgi:hypothetical protein
MASPGRKASDHTGQHKGETGTHIHASRGIETYYLSVRAAKTLIQNYDK